MAETPATPNNTLTYTDGLPASMGQAAVVRTAPA